MPLSAAASLMVRLRRLPLEDGAKDGMIGSSCFHNRGARHTAAEHKSFAALQLEVVLAALSVHSSILSGVESLRNQVRFKKSSMPMQPSVTSPIP